ANMAGDAAGDLTLGPLSNQSVLISNTNASAPAFQVTNTTTPASQSLMRLTVAGVGDSAFAARVTGDTNTRLAIGGPPSPRRAGGPGNAAVDTFLDRTAANKLSVTTADLDIATIGRGLQVAEGANAKMGTATLAAGTVVVSTTAVTANSRIFLTAQT